MRLNILVLARDNTRIDNSEYMQYSKTLLGSLIKCVITEIITYKSRVVQFEVLTAVIKSLFSVWKFNLQTLMDKQATEAHELQRTTQRILYRPYHSTVHSSKVLFVICE
jgi:hypothetical protein